MEPIGNIQIDTCNKMATKVEQDHPLRCNSHALLDSEGCISLGNILATYDAPINEEHAWALCYLSAKCLETNLLSSDNTPGHKNVLLFKQTSNCSSELIKICPQNGHVVLNVEKTTDVTNPTEFEKDERNGKLLTKSKLISKIAMAVYKALDFGMREDEERTLSFKLEDVLVQMSSSVEDNEILCEPCHCFQNQDQFNEQDILNSCLDQFESTAGVLQVDSADAYYQQICKNLALDALEFWKFLRVAEQASQKLKILCGIGSDHLQRHTLLEKPAAVDRIRDNLKAVAKNWIQVVREIKQGVTLKQRNNLALNDHHEYMKSPYELLMEDIRSRKYKLKEVAESQAREEKKALNLHDIIMKHIRSCPKLQNVSSRVLKPVVSSQKPDLHEELMRSIRQVHHLRAVKSTGSL